MDLSAPHLRPWRRVPYVLFLLGALLVLVTWIVLAISALYGGAAVEWLCPLVCVGVALVGVALPLAIKRVVGVARATRSLGTNEDALALFRTAKYAEALEIWNDLCHRARHAPALHVVYVYNVAVAAMHLGRVVPALTLLERVRASGWLTAPSLAHVGQNVEVARALALALKGELGAARAILDALSPRLTEGRRAVTMLARAVIDAREGREVSFDEEALRNAEGALMLSHIRALRLLEAFTRSCGDASAYREAAGELAVDVRPGELDFMATSWPELRAFMEAHRLLAKSEPT